MSSLALTIFVFESLGLSVSSFFIICNISNIKMELKQFLKFIILPTILIFTYVFHINTLLYIIAYTFIITISLKYSLKINYKKIIILTLGVFCFYQLIINFYSITFNNLGILKVIMFNKYYFVLIFGLLTPLTSIIISYFFRNIFKDNLDIINVDILDTSTYNFILLFLTFGLCTVSYFTPYYGVISNNNYLLNDKLIIIILNLFIFSTLVLFYMLIKTYFRKHLIEQKNKTLQESLQNIKDLNKELHSKRHDFLNNLQVISGLLQLKKYQECFEYITGINSNNYSGNSIRTGLISINALLNSKQLRAKNKNVRMELDISSQLDSSTFHIQDWEITNILGNLIDNAIFEECKVSTLDKYVKIKINEYNNFYNFSVYNKNSYIPSDKKSKIFTSGFTTKGSDGHGMGLYIIKNIVSKYDGHIELESNIETGTNFSIYLPKQNHHKNVSDKAQSYPPQESLGTQTI